MKVNVKSKENEVIYKVGIFSAYVDTWIHSSK